MFGGMFETHEVTFETYIQDKLVNKQNIQAPKEIIMMQFIQLMNQVKDDSRPLKIRMTRPEIIWDSFESKQKTLTNEVAFSNNPMVAWEENRNKDKV